VDWVGRGSTPGDTQNTGRWRPGLAAWLIGLAASGPFWNQQLFTGPFAKAFPQFGDLSYYVGFTTAAIAMFLLNRETRTAAIGTQA
jgi:hypothetical protein